MTDRERDVFNIFGHIFKIYNAPVYSKYYQIIVKATAIIFKYY